MKRLSIVSFAPLAAAAIVLLALAGNASAVPFVVAGSSYNANLANFSPRNFNLTATTTFDGLPQVFALNAGGSVTVTESETNLGGGLSRIDIAWAGDTDLFPASLGDSFGGVNIGFDGNPLDLSHPVKVTSATLQYTLGSGAILAAETIIFIDNPNPWDGTYVANGTFVGFLGSDGIDVRRVDLSITVAALVPEPATATLGLLSLAGLIRRRRAG